MIFNVGVSDYQKISNKYQEEDQLTLSPVFQSESLLKDKDTPSTKLSK